MGRCSGFCFSHISSSKLGRSSKCGRCSPVISRAAQWLQNRIFPTSRVFCMKSHLVHSLSQICSKQSSVCHSTPRFLLLLLLLFLLLAWHQLGVSVHVCAPTLFQLLPVKTSLAQSSRLDAHLVPPLPSVLLGLSLSRRLRRRPFRIVSRFLPQHESGCNAAPPSLARRTNSFNQPAARSTHCGVGTTLAEASLGELVGTS